MGKKRAVLIIGGTVGGLGAVLAYQPPQFGATASGGLVKTGGSTTTAATPAPAQTQAAAGQTQSAAPAPAKTTAAPAAPVAAKPSGTFVGATSQTRWGPVQVQITLANGKITAAKALQSPSSDPQSASISQQAIPYLVAETLKANSSNIQGVGGASYTSQGWYDSLVSALAKAGL